MKSKAISLLLLLCVVGLVGSHECTQRLSDAGKSGQQVSTRNVTVWGQIGTTSILPCNIPDNVSFNVTGGVNVTWVKKDKGNMRITMNTTVLIPDRRYVVTRNNEKNWTLSIWYSNDEDAGLYACKATTNPPETLYVTLNLTESYAEILNVTNGQKRVKFGSPLRLSCLLRNSRQDPTYIFWYFENRMINYDLEDGADIRFGKTGSELIIPRANISHEGNYSCVPSNARQMDVFVIVTGPGAEAMRQKQARNYSNRLRSQDFYGELLIVFVIAVVLLGTERV